MQYMKQTREFMTFKPQWFIIQICDTIKCAKTALNHVNQKHLPIWQIEHSIQYHKSQYTPLIVNNVRMLWLGLFYWRRVHNVSELYYAFAFIT